MLHIHNGDSSADTARQSNLPGEHFAFRESLMTGPTPAGVERAEWRQLRARHLAESYDVDFETCERELLQQEEKLGAVPAEDETVLWFEHDLFCQVHLIYLLNWFTRQSSAPNLSLICIKEFPGKPKFRGLGELNADELASLFPQRQPVTAEQFQLATAAWQAFTSPTRETIEQFLAMDTNALPFLKTALRAHLRRFPSDRNGLGAIESRGLELIKEGLRDFPPLFNAFAEVEPIFGLGDAQFWLTLNRMATALNPLIKVIQAGTENKIGINAAHESSFKLTEAGEEVLQGRANFIKLNGIDLWLGGVHLKS